LRTLHNLRQTLSRLMAILLFWGGAVSMVQAASSAQLFFEMPALDPNNQASLQRGAKYYMNYCSGCHSLQYMRYDRMAKDIGMTDDKGNITAEILKKNLIFFGNAVGDQIKSAMNPEQARHWFGMFPPDLSLTARSRSPEWVYNYLLMFYQDPKRPWGVNNFLIQDVAMPDVLLPLRGIQVPIMETIQGHKVLEGFTEIQPGALTTKEFHAVVYDIVNFLEYVADPVKVERHRMGILILLFLSVLLVFAYLLKREYWKSVK
jgi:ubiquinol-cytochrome c reductase cytochrome c1 subunit